MNENMKDLRRACKVLGIKIKKETLSWGPHVSFIIDGQRVSPDRGHGSSIHNKDFYERNRVAIDGLEQIRIDFAGLMYNGEKVYGI
jgi:hypothetical protein